ncbi:MAG: dihydrofolate reductase [Clostridiales bacterium]|jgi:dihydrofolate reductase|nr:dihydrofolate reductase [Clostridiales bacterium]
MLSIIAAVAENGAIGKNNALPWRISDDLRRFKSVTLGKTVIMGRRTFESIPRVLSGRDIVVISSNPMYSAENAIVENDLYKTLNAFKDSPDETFVAGGAIIYEKAMPFCQKLYLTQIFKAFDADAFFPPIPKDEFEEYETSEKFTDEKNGLRYRFVNLRRK